MAITVDKEWAKSLIGLRMKVKESWCDDFSGKDLCPGEIVDVDFDDELGHFFILQLDGDEYRYHMRYDAVLLYSDKEDANFHTFHLPNSQPEDDSNQPGEDEDGLEEDDDEEVIDTIFTCTEAKEWKRVNGTSAGKEMDPVPFTGDNELFIPNLDDATLDTFVDANGIFALSASSSGCFHVLESTMTSITLTSSLLVCAII